MKRLFFGKMIPIAALATTLVGPSSAWALTTLKQVQVSSGAQVDLLFDGKVSKAQIKPEFFNDVIQINLTDAAVYPAKISSINGASLVKIFAYQYAPKLVRCRFTVKGKADDYKDRIQIVSNGKVLTVKIVDASQAKVLNTQKSDKLVVSQAAAQQQASAPAKAQSASAAGGNEAPGIAASEERALLEHVMKSAAPVQAAAAATTKEEETPITGNRKNSGKLTSAKPLPSPLGVMAKLLGVIALFCVLAIAAKKMLSRGGGSKRRLMARLNSQSGPIAPGGFLESLTRIVGHATNGLGRKEKMIEVISNHHLGPKKSIAVVRVLGRVLVLGVTNDSINLISQLSGDEEFSEESLAEVGLASAFAPQKRQSNSPVIDKSINLTLNHHQKPAAAFAQTLSAEVAKPQTTIAPTVRNQIRNRLEGLKPL